ncbi:MAG: gamma-glutamylcyclotransferase [Candidatus Methanomethyliaceae archaeon]|nr:gamma-glutamylcyclotransferase [Candidatus Methanomethyliaceae archaeon]
MKKKVNKIFVYGTLEKTEFFSDLISSGEIRYVGNGKIRAKLYDLVEYPGAVEHKRSYVYGRVYEIHNMDKVLPLLDEYEEFYPDKPEDSLFIRKVMRVIMENGENLRAFVYIYNRSVDRMKVISTGIWLKDSSL